MTDHPQRGAVADHSQRGAMTAALTIAGSDSSGGAGVQADLKTFAAHGVHGLSAVTAVTVQDAAGVRACQALPPELVEAQIAAATAGPGVAAVKTGMLATAAIVEVVAGAAARLALPRLVVDPVLASSRGDPLLDDDGVALLVRALLPRAAVVTPNRTEAERLAGMLIASLADAREAARRIHDLGPRAVVVTGGHLEDDPRNGVGVVAGGRRENDPRLVVDAASGRREGDPRYGVDAASGRREDGPQNGVDVVTGRQSAGDARLVVDVVYDGRDFTELRVARVPGPTVHGTGCTFAAALAAALAHGRSTVEATAEAQRFVAGAMRHAVPAGPAGRTLAPFWQARQPGS